MATRHRRPKRRSLITNPLVVAALINAATIITAEQLNRDAKTVPLAPPSHQIIQVVIRGGNCPGPIKQERGGKEKREKREPR